MVVRVLILFLMLSLSALIRAETTSHDLASIRETIKKNHDDLDRETRAAWSRQGNADGLDDLPDELYSLYYSFVESAVEYADHAVSKGDVIDRSIVSSIEIYGDVLLEAEFKEDEVEDLMEKYEKIEEEVGRRTRRDNWYVYLGYISWQDQIDFIDSTGRTHEITAPAEGTAVGVGWRNSSFYWGYKFELSYGLLSANAGFNSDTANYFQKGVDVTLLNAEGGLFIKPFTGDVAIGFNVPVFYKNGSYEAASNTRIEGASKISTGVVIEGMWYVNEWLLSSRIGKIIGLSSGYWGVFVGYNF